MCVAYVMPDYDTHSLHVQLFNNQTRYLLWIAIIASAIMELSIPTVEQLEHIELPVQCMVLSIERMMMLD